LVIRLFGVFKGIADRKTWQEYLPGFFDVLGSFEIEK